MLNRRIRPEWFVTYTDAMLETNAERAAQKIPAAERAMLARIAQIGSDTASVIPERRDIESALKNLELLSRYPCP